MGGWRKDFRHDKDEDWGAIQVKEVQMVAISESRAKAQRRYEEGTSEEVGV